MFLSSPKCDPGCSSRFQIFIFSPIPDPGSRGQKDAGFQNRPRIRIRNTAKNGVASLMPTEILLVVCELLLHLVQNIVLVHEALPLLLHDPLNGSSEIK
jgi:hypothetical protein